MSVPENEQVKPIEGSKLRVFRFSDNLGAILATQTLTPSDNNANLALWHSMKKDVETIMSGLAQRYSIQSWTPETYAENYISKYLKEYGFAPEVVEVTPNKIVFRNHSCPALNSGNQDHNSCTFCENFEVLAAKTTLGGKAVFVKTIAKSNPYCEIEISL